MCTTTRHTVINSSICVVRDHGQAPLNCFSHISLHQPHQHQSSFSVLRQINVFIRVASNLVIMLTDFNWRAAAQLCNYMQGKVSRYSPPGYSPNYLLIIVKRWVIWFACVQRSTWTSCRTPSSAEWHANRILCIEADKPNRNWFHSNVPREIEKLTSDPSSTVIVLSTP